jgi:hypothetical protein
MIATTRVGQEKMEDRVSAILSTHTKFKETVSK